MHFALIILALFSPYVARPCCPVGLGRVFAEYGEPVPLKADLTIAGSLFQAIKSVETSSASSIGADGEAGSCCRPIFTDGHTATEGLLMNVSAYCPGRCCCGEFADGITASGRSAEGFLVAAPPEIPFGTLLVIPGYNEGLPVPVLDRGGAIKGNKLDVFFNNHDDALDWGRQQLKVKILARTKQ